MTICGVLIGPTVFERQPATLARDKHIADYKVERVSVDLTDDEQARYDQTDGRVFLVHGGEPHQVDDDRRGQSV